MPLLLLLLLLLLLPLLLPSASALAQQRTIALDERLASDAGIRVGDVVILSGQSGVAGDTVRVSALVGRRADPSEVSRNEYRVRLHLDHLQSLIGYGDRVDRFGVASRAGATEAVVRRVNDQAFGFRAHRSRDVAVETSRTFAVVSRFHRAIGVITIVASAIFLLCIMLLKVEERRRDVAALRLLGVSSRTVIGAVVLEAGVISLLGSALGLLIGWASTLAVNAYYQGVYRTPLKFAIATPGLMAFAVTLSLVLGIGAGAVAALRLTRTPPLTLLGR